MNNITVILSLLMALPSASLLFTVPEQSQELTTVLNHIVVGGYTTKGKGKVGRAPPERRRGAHLPFKAIEPVGG